MSMEGPRAPRESELRGLYDFLNRELRPNSKWSIADEYPRALQDFNRHNMRVILEGERVLSHAVLKPFVIKTPIGAFKLAGIGSVVTEGGHRGQGLSTQVLESCLHAAESADCEIAILWTELYDFYRRLGFELAGSEVALQIDGELKSPARDLRFLDTAQIDADALLRVYNQHSVGTHRGVDDVREYLRIPNSRVCTAWDKHGKLVAYAIEGKGADLSGYIHEWGGGVGALTALISHMWKTRRSPEHGLTLIAPHHSENLIRTLTSMGVRRHDGHLGMIKILRHESIFAKVRRAARQQGIGDLVLERTKTDFRIGRGQQIYATQSEQDITRLLFGPALPHEIHSFDPSTAQALKSILPIPLWIWGWDSV
jgi:GNAT superfamily N-acetyltransferase